MRTGLSFAKITGTYTEQTYRHSARAALRFRLISCRAERSQSRVFAAEAADTHYSTFYDVGWPNAPHRVLRNSTIEAWENAGRPSSGNRPGEGGVIVEAGEDDQVVRYKAVAARKDYQGDVEAMPLFAGQGVGFVRRRPPAAEIVAEIISETEAVIACLARF